MSNNLLIVENAPSDNFLSYKPSASSMAMHCKGQSYASKNDVYKISRATKTNIPIYKVLG